MYSYILVLVLVLVYRYYWYVSSGNFWPTKKENKTDLVGVARTAMKASLPWSVATVVMPFRLTVCSATPLLKFRLPGCGVDLGPML
jgi:hypothetical protein